jgi:hypothetical protein
MPREREGSKRGNQARTGARRGRTAPDLPQAYFGLYKG